MGSIAFSRLRTDILAEEFLHRIQNGIQLTFVSDSLLDTLIDELTMEREFRTIKRTSLVSKIMTRIKKQPKFNPNVKKD
jgi:hypothetical protein